MKKGVRTGTQIVIPILEWKGNSSWKAISKLTYTQGDGCNQRKGERER